MIDNGEVAVSFHFSIFFPSISSMAPLEHAKNIYPKLAELASLLHISPHSPHLSFFQPSPFLAEGLEFSYLLGVLGQVFPVFLVHPNLPAISPLPPL